MSTITPHFRSVKQLLQTQSFSIDEYQREYKWEKANIEELVTDLYDKFRSCYQDGDSTSKVGEYEEYFLGSIIVSKRGNKNYLIDGQQRVTSLTLLLIYLYRAAAEKNLSVKDSIGPLIFSDNLGVPSFNLDIPERLPVIKALFDGSPFNADDKDESVQTMYARYEDIRARDLVGELSGKNNNEPGAKTSDALPHFCYWLMTKVGLIEIATDNDNYAYAIFETMNDRGKPLSPVDMLKAYLLAPVIDADQRRNANQIWKKNVLDLISSGGEHESERDAAAIKAWLRSQYAVSIRERKAGSKDQDWELIGSAFHRWARDNHERLGLGSKDRNLAMMTEEFPFFARAYERIVDASRKYTKGLEAVFYNAHNDFTWQNTVLLAPFSVEDSPETVQRKMAVIATYLDIWLMRRTVNYIRVGYSSTSYTMFGLCNAIRRRSLPDLVEILKKRLAEDEISFDSAPSKGRTGIDGLVINQFSRRYIFHLLARLASFTDIGAGKPDAFDKYVDRKVKNPNDIEHIRANNYGAYQEEFDSEYEFQNWRNHIAGLLLLPADVNRSLQDKTFADKSLKYASENMYAASLTASAYQHQPQFAAFWQQNGLPFKPYTGFGKAEQIERRALVLALVNMVWSPDRLEAAAQW
jgi:uncharacterized protein with ParB-like and HNH nuclease domain